MGLVSVRPSGRLVFVQPRSEHLLQRSAILGVGSLATGFGALFLWVENPPTVDLWIAAVLFALGAPFLYGGARMRPYRLYEDGIVLPSRRFIGYGRVRDVQRTDSSRGKSKFLVLAIADGTVAVIGTPFTKHVVFSTREFDRVEALVVRGVGERGPRADIEWDPELWKRVFALKFRGPVIVNAEKSARELGRPWIDEEFLDCAALANKRLKWWLASAAFATARSARQPKRNSTP